MKSLRLFSRPVGIAVLTLASVLSLRAQAPAPADVSTPDTKSPDEVVVMSPFAVESDEVHPYEAAEATSGGRVRTSLFDTSQSISVITSALIADVGADSVLAASQYSAGVTQSTQPNGADRVTIRGFQSTGRTMDGFTTVSLEAMDPFIVERMEIVRGPNAILSPSGVPGGTINNVTKKPGWTDFGSFTLEGASYGANRAEFDLNRVVNKDLAIRVVAAGTDGDGYYHDFANSWTAMPELTWRFGRSSELLLQANFNHVESENYVGVPIDPSAGTDNRAVLLKGLSPTYNPYDGDDRRIENRQEFLALYTTQVTDAFSIRAAAHYFENHQTYLQFQAGNSAPGGSVNPLTGDWVPGEIFSSTAPYTATPAPQPGALYTRGSTQQGTQNRQYDFQNDYVYQFKSKVVNSTTTAGLAATFNPMEPNEQEEYSRPSPYNIYQFVPTPATPGPYSQLTRFQSAADSLYANDSLNFLSDRITLSGGVSKSWFDSRTIDYLAHTDYTVRPSKLNKSYGIVVAPLEFASLYYGHSESAAPTNAFPVAGFTPPALQDAKQDEAGIHLKFLQDRGTASVAYYQIQQNNFSIFNPGNLAVPPPNPALPALYTDRIARGWEYETNFAVTKEFSVIANYTYFRNRDAFDVPFRGTAENSGALWARYNFDDGRLKGLGLGLGETHLAKRPGDTATGVTSASTPTNVIPVQPSFYLPAYSLTDFTASYRYDQHWTQRFFVDNVFNTKYIAASLTRYSVYPGLGINFRASVTYSF